MTRKLKIVDTVRERELHFSKRECGFVQQSDTSNFIKNKKGCKAFISNIKNKKTHISSLTSHHSGVTLVALVITLIVLLILAGVTITSLVGDNGMIRKSQETANIIKKETQNEEDETNMLIEKLNNIMSDKETGEDDAVEMPSGWDSSKVVAVKSDDGVVVPIPKGFTKSTVSGEGSVSTGFVIKQGNDGSLTEGINEFVWVPVDDPSEMFGTDAQGDSLGKLYDFGTSTTPKKPPAARNWTEENEIMGWDTGEGYREPDIVTYYDGSDATGDSSYFKQTISQIMTGTQFKTQLQQEFEEMRYSVETYGGFYIGRYETGNLSEEKAVVQKNNTDINNQTWYVQYQKCKTVAEETSGTSSMIWGCQWDATLKWFLESSDPEVVKYVTDSTGKGNYSGSLLANGTGSVEEYSINKIYDMAGNVLDWTLETINITYRVNRRGLLQ